MKISWKILQHGFNLGGKLMISFENDYLEGAHEQVLKRLVETNRIQAAGYGFDDFSAQAADKIRETIQCPDATIRFLVGGTQTNQVVINSMLKVMKVLFQQILDMSLFMKAAQLNLVGTKC